LLANLDPPNLFPEMYILDGCFEFERQFLIPSLAPMGFGFPPKATQAATFDHRQIAEPTLLCGFDSVVGL